MSVYERFRHKDFSLNDYLALERTILANERTYLSYLRTSLTMLIAGVTGIELFHASAAEAASLIVAALGALVGAFGTWRFMRIKRRLDIASPAIDANTAAIELSNSAGHQAQSCEVPEPTLAKEVNMGG